jgi:hypothetical protein
LAALAKIGLGLLCISFAIVGARRRPGVELLRAPALALGLAIVFLAGV